MGLHSRLQALKHYIWRVPTIEDKSPEELTSRAERAILDTTSEKSRDSILEAKEGKVSSSPSTGGLDCTVRNLYLDKVGVWTDKNPHLSFSSAENETTSGYALVVRNRKALDGRKKFEIESLVVQSPLLKRALQAIFKDYPGITLDVDRLEFASPFQPFVHRWHEFEQATVKETHLETKHHLALLWNVLEAELKDLLQKIKDHERHGVIDFANIWTIFEPNALVLTDHDGSERLYRCVKGSSDTAKYDIETQYVDWDGDRFGTVTSTLTIRSFRGTKKLTSLSAMPLSRHPKRVEIEKRLLARGKIFQDLKGYHFKDYNGIGVQESTNARYNVNSRIIIDTSAYNLMNPKSQAKVDRIKDSPTKRLSDSNLLLTTNTVRAYSLKDKRWLSVSIPSIRLIKFSTSAFSTLVLPPASKDLVLAFATSSTNATPASTSSDVIKDKGLGTVLLLSGPPGVGKTLTAESVAEAMRVPLYSLSAGDLGTNPKDVERVLTSTLQLAAKWRAMILLDEADVFLLSRNNEHTDLERNKLVSIFLRVLEYHSGFLFLTTNRMEDVDAAFESRIHLSLQYRELDGQARRKIWANLLQPSKHDGKSGEDSKTESDSDGWASLDPSTTGFTISDLDELASYEMNGRQIKNAVRSARMLAESRGAGGPGSEGGKAEEGKGEKFNIGHLRVVLKVREENRSAFEGKA